jgi:hypothetical protein
MVRSPGLDLFPATDRQRRGHSHEIHRWQISATLNLWEKSPEFVFFFNVRRWDSSVGVATGNGRPGFDSRQGTLSSGYRGEGFFSGCKAAWA